VNRVQQVSEAIADCLTTCTAAEFPLARIAEFLDELRNRGWKERDRHLVEVTVLRALLRIAARQAGLPQPLSDCLSGNQTGGPETMPSRRGYQKQARPAVGLSPLDGIVEFASSTGPSSRRDDR
jgi:hypothetical protein